MCTRSPTGSRFDWSIRSLRTAHTFDPVCHVILIWSLSGESCPMRPIDLFRIVADEFSLFAIHHVGRAPSVMVPSLPRMCSPNPKCLLLKVDCQVTTMSLGKPRVTAIVSGN
jgi:hypothetical protein